MRWMLCCVVLLCAAACATRRAPRARAAPRAPAAAVPAADDVPPAGEEPPPPAAAAAPSAPRTPDSGRRLANADARLALVRAMRGWPSEEDRARWKRDVAVAEDARGRVDASADAATYEDAVTRYENAVAVAFASYQTIEMGARAREGR